MSSLPVESVLRRRNYRDSFQSIGSSNNINQISLLAHQDEIQDVVLKRDIFPVSSEFDMLREQFFIQDGQDRSEWTERFLKDNPEIKDFIERVDPVSRAVTFAKLYLPPNRIANQSVLLSLISQHFRILGLIDSQASLHEEWNEQLQIPAHLLRSQLNFIVQRGIYHAERFWELSLPSPSQHQNAAQLLDQEISKIIGGSPNVGKDVTPLSSEECGDPRFLNIQNGEIVEASLNQIIWLLTTENKGNADLMQAVCLTYRSFTTSKVFFNKIRERFQIAYHEYKEEKKKMEDQEKKKEETNGNTAKDGERKPGNTFEDNMGVKMRSLALTFKLFGTWMKEASDSIEQSVFDAAQSFAKAELADFPNYLPTILSPRKKESQVTDFSKAPPVVLGDCDKLWSNEFTLFDLPPIELARQLTVMSSSKYYAIARSELLDGAWNVPRLKHRSPNICALTTQFNKLALWVQTSILTENSLSLRITKMKFLLETMLELYKMQNYLDLFALYMGFYDESVYRLKCHLSMLSKEQQNFLNELSVLSSPTDNSKNTLELHAKAIKTGKPSLPLLPVLLSIIFKYSDGTEAVVKGLVNLRKCRRMLSLMREVESFQKLKYIFLPIEQVQMKLMFLEVKNEDTFMELSYDIEPDGATMANLKNQI